MTKKKAKWSVTNMVVMLALLAALVGVSWQQVGAQRATPPQECSAKVDKRADKGDVRSDCARDEKSKGRDDGLERLAARIGIDARTLRGELKAGNSIAQVAQANGVDPQPIIDALVAEKQAEIDELLAAGEISEEKAAAWQAKLVEGVRLRLNHVEVEPFVVAAQTLRQAQGSAIGTDVGTLSGELKAGQTMAEVAQANRVEGQTVVDPVIAAEEMQIEQKLAAGFITEGEAQEWRDKVHQFASAAVNMTQDTLRGD